MCRYRHRVYLGVQQEFGVGRIDARDTEAPCHLLRELRAYLRQCHHLAVGQSGKVGQVYRLRHKAGANIS